MSCGAPRSPPTRSCPGGRDRGPSDPVFRTPRGAGHLKRSRLRHNRHPDRQHRTRAVAPVARDDPSPQRLDKTATDRQTEPGAGTPAILRLDPVEFVENALEIGRWYPGSLIDDFDLDEFSITL